MTSEQDLIVFDSELTNGSMKSLEDANTPLPGSVKEKKAVVESKLENGCLTKEGALPSGKVTSESSILLVDLSSTDTTKVNGEISVSEPLNNSLEVDCKKQATSENTSHTEVSSKAEDQGATTCTSLPDSGAPTVHVLEETEVLQTEAIKEVVEISIASREERQDEPYRTDKSSGGDADKEVDLKEKSELNLVVVQENSAEGVQSKTRVYRSTLTLSENALSNGNKDKKSANGRSAETKIAMEIREMREREDELRRMRERLMSNTSCPEQNGHMQSDGSVKSDDIETPSGSESPSQEIVSIGFRDHREIARAVSLDSIHMGQTYNIGYVFAHRRRENIKVRPLADEDDAEDKPIFSATEESPIEREIRLAKEREEELRKEKALFCNGIKNTSKVESETTETVNGSVTNATKKQEVKKKNGVIERPQTIELNGVGKQETNNNKANHSPIDIKLPITSKVEPKNSLTTQKLIATSRIQQEIEEQTKREMALRESGHIQTISQERTDSKVTRLSELTVKEKSKSPPARDTSPTVEIYEKSLSNGHSNGKANGNGKSPSSTTSSSSSSSKPLLPPVARRLSNPSTCRNVSMQRFIASRGKEIAFYNGLPGDRSTGIPDYYEIKPPQVRRGDGKPHRRSITAESRIQEELKEMKDREDELIRQRSRLLGLSQPNLSALVDKDDTATNGDCQEETTPLERCSSNPNLLENGVDDEVQEPSVGGPRRRSILIDQWEQRIQAS